MLESDRCVEMSLISLGKQPRRKKSQISSKWNDGKYAVTTR